MLSDQLPYYNLTDEQFTKEIGAWVYNSIDNLYARSKDLFKDIVESPDKANDFNENLIYDSIESKYHTIKQLGNRFSNVKGKWQYIFYFSHLKELLKLFNNFFYRFFISCLVLEIFSLEMMRCQPSWIQF